jgi:ATP-binding cassette subfamily B protein
LVSLGIIFNTVSALMSNYYYHNLYRILKPYTRSLLFCLILMFIATFFNLLPAYVLIQLMNEVLIPIQNHTAYNHANIYLYFAIFLMSSILSWLFSWLKTLYLATNSENISKDLRLQLFKHILNLSLDFFHQQRAGELISKIGNETDELNLFISVSLLDFIQDFVLLIGIFGMVFYINYKIALLNMLLMPIIFLLVFKIKGKVYYGFDEASRIWATLISFISESVHGIKTIKSYVQENKIYQFFVLLNDKNFKINYYMNRVWSLFLPTSAFLNELNLICTWGFGIYLMIHQQINLGELMGLITYMNKLYARSESMSRFFESYKRVTAKIKRSFEILNKKTSLIQTANPIPIADGNGLIEIKNISFNYQKAPVLKNVSLSIKPLEKVAFVGYSGSGKSTLVNLICRFFDPNMGEILLDGQNIKNFDIKEYMKKFAIVTQEPYVFYGTIADNIAFGKEDATPQEIVEAAKLAQCHDFIMQKTFAYDTLVQDNANVLSGGEKQRIVIARAMLTKPKFLILDEASSAMDLYTEELLNQSLETLSKTTTTIIISHRLSNLNAFDRIYFIKDGEIVESGSHDELMNLKQFYYSFVNIHQKLHKEHLL